jgi:hypothetical protein
MDNHIQNDWNGITFDKHFDKQTLEFVFPDGSRQKVYSQIVNHHTNTRLWNPVVIPSELKKAVFDFLLQP